jgi:MFS family permease
MTDVTSGLSAHTPAIGGSLVNFVMLVSARAVHAMFAALPAPAVLALLTTTFSDAGERGRPFVVYGAIVEITK